MKKGPLYYFAALSLLLHLLVILGLKQLGLEYARLEDRQKEPIAIDLVGPLKQGEKTVVPRLPEGPPDAPPGVRTPEKDTKHTEKPLMTARAAPLRPAPRRAPAVPSRPPVPAPAPPTAGADRPEPPDIRPGETGPGAVAPSPADRTPVPSADAVPAKPGPAAPDDAPRRLVQPSVEDLMRYAKVDKEVQRVDPDKEITLDTDDLMYTSYMQGLKRRIELIWKYPEAARQDGLQGELVMRFSIEKSGKVDSVELIKSSGYPILDRAAEQALLDASPFNPLPDSWGKEQFIITGTFIYKLYGLYLR